MLLTFHRHLGRGLGEGHGRGVGDCVGQASSGRLHVGTSAADLWRPVGWRGMYSVCSTAGSTKSPVARSSCRSDRTTFPKSFTAGRHHAT